MIKHEISKPSYEVAQSGFLSSDIFLSVEGKPVNVGQAPLETHNREAEPVPQELASIPFKGVKHPDIDPEVATLRNKYNAVPEARRIKFFNVLSVVVDYDRTKEKSKPSYEKHKIFQQQK